jgi:Ca2+-binding RTX toxin-like protein
MRVQTSFRLAVATAVAFSIVALPARPAGAAARCFGRKATQTGTNGKDRLEGTRKRDVIVGRGGDDLLVGFQGNDLLCGNGGDDTIAGVGGNDLLNGGAGFDVLLGMKGNDRAVGGPGRDLMSFFYANSGMRANLGTGRASGEGSDRLKGIENLEGGRHRDRLIGSKKTNLLNGARGSDRLIGKAGDDVLLPRAGRDKLLGGDDQDLATYFFSKGVNGDLGTGVVKGEGRDRLTGVEALEGSNKAGDRLTGNGGDNVLLGEGGSDSLFGMGGGDFVDGGRGHDPRVVGGNGNDFMAGGAGNDKLGAVSDEETEEGDDFLRAAGGDDRLFGGVGGDLLEGGPGNDFFDGGVDFDFVTFKFATGDVEADLAGGATGWGTDTFEADPLPTIEGLQGSKQGDILTGTAVANSLFGGKGDDELFALEDNDLLVGGDGDDSLDGGLGIDTCRTGEQKTSCELPVLGIGSGVPSIPSVERVTGLTESPTFSAPEITKRLR